MQAPLITEHILNYIHSNWSKLNSFQIWSIQFKNLQFEWFEKAKKSMKISSNCILESNWNLFEICLIQFKNLQFHFERAKNIWKIWWKLIWICNSTDLKGEKQFEKFDKKDSKFGGFDSTLPLILAFRLDCSQIVRKIGFIRFDFKGEK